MEVECKVRIDPGGVAALEGRLAAAGAVDHGASTQVDTYFHHPTRDLAAGDEAFRLRQDRGFELTYKGPRAPGDLKMREELNVAVASDPTALIEALGFRPAAQLVKQRHAWSLAGCHVTLDHIEGLGWFVEVEAGEGLDDPIATIDAVLQRLGLAREVTVTESYLEMALAAGASAATRL